MDLPNIERGMRILADDINRISREVRASALTSVIGGQFTRSASGTSISIDGKFFGGGSGTAGALCAFNVVDASEKNTQGQLVLKLRVNVAPIEPGGRYPTGTSAEVPYKIITLGELTPSWQCVYLQIVVDQKNEILEGDPGINIYYAGNAWPESNSVIQNTYLAGVTISDDGEGGTYISDITNYCPMVRVQPPPTCAFKIEDYSLGTSTDVKISIRSTQIERHYPTGMDDTITYVLTIPDTQQWFAVYAVLVTDSDGNIKFEENNVTLSLETTYKDSTETTTYFLLGEVNTGYDVDSNRVIDYIFNACQVPFITGAVALDGTVVPRGTSAVCPFRVKDATEGDTVQVEVSQHTVNTNTGARWPLGMGVDSPPYLIPITDTAYIYVKLTYVTNDVIVKPDADAITITSQSQLVENTVNDEFVLLAIVTKNGNVLTIANQCVSVTANPCNLKWS